MTTQRQVTSVTTKRWSDYIATTFGPTCGRSARSPPYSASCALAINPLTIVLAARCSLYQSRSAHDTLLVWNLSSMYPRLTVSPLSWWLLSVCVQVMYFHSNYGHYYCPDVAGAFASHVFSKHGIFSGCPLTTDRNSPLLGSLLRMRLHFTSGHHPSANGQVERVNTTLKQYLRMYCNYEQDNWSTPLPLAGSAPRATTGVFPCFATRTYDPLALSLTQAPGTEPRQGDQPDPHGCAADVSRL